MTQRTPQRPGPAQLLRPSLAGGRVALLAVAGALVFAALLALAWAGTSPAGAQDGGLQVSITANPANPPVNEPTMLTATITNPPLEGKPAYDWQIDFGDGNWFSVGSNSTLRYLAGEAETLGFRLTVSYGSGETATSEPITVTWVEAGEEPTPEPTEEPTPTPEPTPEPTPVPTEEPPEPPGAPAGLTATGGDATIDLNWSGPTDGAISRYQVRVSADGGTGWDPDWTDISGGGPDTTSHRLTGLTNDTEYTIELRAVRGASSAGPAARATAMPRPEPPPAPAGLKATGGYTTIDLNWSDPSDGAITKYQVRVSADGGAGWDPDWTDVSGSGAATTSHTLTGLTNDTAYTIELRALRGETVGAAASARSTPRPEPPPSPDGLTATGGDTTIDLRWSDPSDSAISRYQVRVSADGGTAWDPDWTDIPGSGAATTSHTLTGLTNDTEYTIELRAVRGASSAGPAASATATPSEPAPAQEPTPTPEPTPSAEDGYEPDPDLIDDVWEYAREMDHGHVHVLRWMRVLKTLGAVADMTAVKAQENANQFSAERWEPVVAELEQLEASGDYEPDREVVDNVRTYAREMEHGSDHVLRWMKVRKTFGDLADMSAAEAQGYADKGWERWDPVVEELEKKEAARPPNRAPVVNTQAANYAHFTFMGNAYTGNAPRGILVSKPFHGVFSDPDGDELTYTVSIPADQRQLVELLEVVRDQDVPVRQDRPRKVGLLSRVWLRLEAEGDWKGINPALADPLTIRVTLTATDPGGLSATVGGGFRTDWASEPGLVSARASGQTIRLTFDLEVEANPAPRPGQFTVRVVNGDGSEGTIAVSSVAVNGKVVMLELASELAEDQTVTVDYAYDSHDADDVPLQRTGEGDAAPGFSGRAVVWSLLEPPANFSVSVTAGSLDLSAAWDAVEAATFYRLRWRQAGVEFEAANETTVTETSATITVSGYGEWEVQLQACNDDGCVPEDDVPSVPLSLEPALEDQSRSEGEGQSQSQGRARARSSPATRNRVGDAASYTLGWRQAGANPETLEVFRPDDGRHTRGASGPSGDGGQRANKQTDTTPPRLERGEIDGDTMTFYFSEALDEDRVGSQFRVTLDWGSGWVNFTAHPTRVEVSGNKVVVYGLSYMGWPGWERAGVGQRVTAYYYKDDRFVPAAEKLRDLAGNEVLTPHRSLGGHFPATRTIELNNLTAPPAVQRAAAHPAWLTLIFNKALDGDSVPAAGAFTVTVNGSAVSLASADPVAVSGDAVTLLLAAPVGSTDEVRVSYTQPSGSPLRGLDGAVKSFPARSVTNRVGLEPSVSAVAITSTPADGEAYAPGETIRVKLTFTEAVNVAGAPRLRIKLAPSYGKKWADYAGGSGTTELTFAYTVAEPDRSTRGVAVLRDTLDLNGGAIRSATTAATDAHLWHQGLSHDPDHMVDWHRSAPGVPWVTGVALTSVPRDGDTYALGETIEVKATFSEAVDVDTTGGTPRLKIRMAPYLWWMNQGLSWMGTDHEERWANYASGSGTAELTFDYTVLAENRTTQGVAVLGSGLDRNGSAIRSAAAPPENAHLRYEELWHDRDHRVDGRAPALLTVAVAGTKVGLTFSEALDEDSVPPASAFRVQRTPQGGTEETVGLSGAPSIAAGAVVLTLADAVVGTDTGVKVSYGPPAANRLRDRAGNEAAGFTGQEADPTDTTPPRLVKGEVDGDTMTIYFSEALDEDWVGDGDYFRFHLEPRRGPHNYGQCANEDITITANPRELYVRGNTAVVVGLSIIETRRATVDSTIFDVRYVADVTVARRLRDLSGNPVSTPNHRRENLWQTRSIRLENVTWLPSPERATVVGRRLTLTFDAPMDGGRTPAAGAFTVKVDGSAVSLAGANAVAVTGRQVTLTLAAAVAAGADVTVSYEKPARNWLRNVTCEYAESFADEPVINFTGASPATATIISDAGDDNTYGRGDVIRVRLTFSEAVEVTGKPGLQIDLDPADGGERWAGYESGSGTNSLTFAYRVFNGNLRKEPDLSKGGVAVIANSLGPSSGMIRYASSGDPAYLAHTGLGHDPAHKVDWRR